jgi:KipI family sensor histidine kinase inhibitor
MEAGNAGMKVSRETGPLRWITDLGLCVAGGNDTLALYRRLTEAAFPEVAEWVPADGMLLGVLRPGADTPPGLDALLASSEHPGEGLGQNRAHVIPVRFDGEDLTEIADRTGLGVEVLVENLCSLTLRVKFLGFQPGFAYLDGLPPELRLPRRANPRKRVPPGSVALGGAYCGIYPAVGPGGWHLIGTTDAWLFDPARVPPARFQAGDSVKLVAA